HDLRTPLTLIKSYAEMVRDLSGDDKVKREKHLNTRIKEAERLTNMVNDILKLSKSEKTGELNLEKYNFSQQVNEIVDMMINGNGDDYVVERDITPKIYVTADKHKISQVIINFLSNAFKYGGDEKYVRVVLKQYGDKLRFDVYDKGIGISKEELPYVWDRYTKASLKHKMGDSNGIGLSIAKSILLQHDGKYGVNSELGKGSNFYFELKAIKE
ncbi:MAG: HAMP domain-containing histidine kinase, partial [Clostridia bacterium]|nr:HAMP domain-containing histidine kinase [Clostridia bacterium]